MAVKTFAAIDVGSYELAMKIFEVSPKVGLKEIDHIRHKIELGTESYGQGKISICFEVPHESGSLYHMLSHFIYNNLNMCKIESRPIEDRNWEYRFFIDFEGNLADSAVKNALRGLRDEARSLKILGNY